VNGHRCRQIIGMAAQFYPSGQTTNVRQVTVWIDAESLLVRKVFEDTPKGYPMGSYLRVTITVDPQINPSWKTRISSHRAHGHTMMLHPGGSTHGVSLSVVSLLSRL
jgi:hypothetical protein